MMSIPSGLRCQGKAKIAGYIFNHFRQQAKNQLSILTSSSSVPVRSFSVRHNIESGSMNVDVYDSDPKPLKRNPNVITIPVRLEKRLERKRERDNSKRAEKQRILALSRQGSKSRLVISCRRPDFNHYYGQSYGPRDDIPLTSKGWGHHKAAGDYFTINSSSKNQALLEPDSGITFETLGVSESLRERVEVNGIKEPTVVQAEAIPKILKGLNCVVAAETGGGKTLAYLLPLLQEITLAKKSRMRRGSKNQPLAVILSPTRELNEQIFNVVKLYTAESDIIAKCLQGGNLGSKIANSPSEEIDLIVSTVNVLSTLSREKVYDLTSVKQIVLDEADTLLDDSFSPSVLNFLAPFRFTVDEGGKLTQLILVSATIPRSADSILEDVFPVDTLVRVHTPGLHNVMSHVPQKFLRMKKSEKVPALIEMARTEYEARKSMMIFCNETDACEWLSKYLVENGIECVELHGHIRPALRKGRIDTFTSGDVPIICCTDIASRGLDTLVTSHVFNFDFPRFLADYIHRCGRTGRVGSKVHGRVTNIITRRGEIALVNEIELSVRKQTALQRVNANIKRLLNARYGMNQQIVPSD